MPTTWKKRKTKKVKKMSETEVGTPPQVVKEKVDPVSDVTLQITKPPEGQVLNIYIRAPQVAKVIRQMAKSNYPKEKFAPIYKDILMDLAEAVGKDVGKLAVTRKAITTATKCFVSAADFSFTEAPRAILLANPDALEAGYTLTYKFDQPVPMDQLKKWGKAFMDGCKELIANARPFRMSWNMNKAG